MSKIVIRRFLKDITQHFPEAVPLMEQHEKWAYTSRFEAFSELTNQAFNSGDIDKAIAYLNYMSDKFESASGIEAEYIDVYYVEHLFFSCTTQGIDLGWSLVPKNLQQLYINFHGLAPNKKL
ncbi:DUF7674 family protein [Pseudoalteromonas phenolica]|uniref:DUF7674 domain-containing protein n=1 Tax=Pseudoalteromonas phenolica TaxID=161398 RepID=A0A0S2K0R4_9GAMM|nr:hypothetical protein [Pseudoalteromonas phenolica]ALO42090.1 hypothetical protein PP2015_1586 [Pseudoalteromonas phenolica]MBE0356819.1 hypothetical protein [Pseudoalteromonas phenolica O-BC30]TMO56772.1 hypothetical protein CWC21_06255 [Pseudoalteromonas phenolica]